MKTRSIPWNNNLLVLGPSYSLRVEDSSVHTFILRTFNDPRSKDMANSIQSAFTTYLLPTQVYDQLEVPFMITSDLQVSSNGVIVPAIHSIFA